jgi:hypothetical protein
MQKYKHKLQHGIINANSSLCGILGVVVHACNTGAHEAEAGKSQIQSCLGYIVGLSLAT